MGVEGKLGVLIEGTDRLSAPLASATQAGQRFDQTFQKLKKTSDDSSQSQQRLASQVLATKNSHDQTRQSMDRTVLTAGVLKDRIEGLAGVLSKLPGPAGQAGSQLAQLASSMGSAGSSMAAFGIGAVAVVGAAAAMAVGFVDLAKKAADYQEHIDQVTERSGLLTREWGALRVAAAANGTSMELVERALDFFTNKIKDASQEGSDAEKMFSNLGISVRDSGGNMKATGQILGEVQTALAGIQNPAVRSGTAMDLFGTRSARAMRTLTSAMEDNARLAESRGVIFSPETEEKLRKVDAAFDNLSLSVLGLKNQFAALAASNLEPFISGLSTIIQKIQDFSDDPKVQTAISLMQLFARLGGQGNPMVMVGRDRLPEENGRPGLSPRQAVDFGATVNTKQLGPFLQGADKARIEAENSFSDAVKRLAKERAAAETEAMKALGEKIESAFSPRFETTISGVRLVGVEKPEPGDPIKEGREDWKAIQQEGKERGEQLKKEAEALAKTNAETDARAAKLKKEGEQLSTRGRIDEEATASLRSGIRGFFSEAISGTASLKQAFTDFVTNLVEEVAASAASNIVLHALGIPVQTGGTFAQGGGTFAPRAPIYAQQGVVTRAPRGLDYRPAMIGGGETVLSHTLTDRLGRVIDTLERGFAQPSQAPSSGPTHRTVNVNLSIQGGTPNRGDTRRWAVEVLAPILNDIMPRNEYRTI